MRYRAEKSGLMDIAVSRCSGRGGIWVKRAVLQQFINMKKGQSSHRLSMVETLTQIPVAGRATPSHKIIMGELPANKLESVLFGLMQSED